MELTLNGIGGGIMEQRINYKECFDNFKFLKSTDSKVESCVKDVQDFLYKCNNNQINDEEFVNEFKILAEKHGYAPLTIALYGMKVSLPYVENSQLLFVSVDNFIHKYLNLTHKTKEALDNKTKEFFDIITEILKDEDKLVLFSAEIYRFKPAASMYNYNDDKFYFFYDADEFHAYITQCLNNYAFANELFNSSYEDVTDDDFSDLKDEFISILKQKLQHEININKPFAVDTCNEVKQKIADFFDKTEYKDVIEYLGKLDIDQTIKLRLLKLNKNIKNGSI